MKKYWRHFKGQNYRVLGVAKDCESLEDFVVYEALYNNPLSRLWIRSKSNFLANVERDGEIRPRFQPIETQISIDEDLRSIKSMWPKLARLFTAEFEGIDKAAMMERLQQFSSPTLLSISMDKQVAAFKLGYALTADKYYSWLGAVDAHQRSQGFASDLMQKQHEWCLEHGFTKVQTKTLASRTEMVRLNLKFGFVITQMYKDKNDQLKLVMEKQLTAVHS